MPVICKFKFPGELGREAIESRLALAIISAECVFGRAKVRISAGYWISPLGETSNGEKGLQIVIDVSTEVGEHIAQVFTGLMIRQLGEDRFTVDRVGRQEPLRGASDEEP